MEPAGSERSDRDHRSFLTRSIGFARFLWWRAQIVFYRGRGFLIDLSAIVAFRHERRRLARISRGPAPGGLPAIAASAGWYFPIYSHTFVYQELTQLIAAGAQLTFFYGALNPSDHLPAQFQPLMDAKRRWLMHHAMCRRSVQYFERRMPERVSRLLEDLARHSGLSRAALLADEHVAQAFAYARLIEALRPRYLHSYFFYQDSLYALVASSLLDIPRGVSCYADHMLADYRLKVVPLHLEQCRVVVATSRRIADELRAIAPDLPADRIVVKANAINADHFPCVDRPAREGGSPFVIVTLCRIEPKKGLTYLADALQHVRASGVAIEWRLLGGVDDNDSSRAYAAELRDRIETLGLRDAVRMLGKRTEMEINDAFREAHVFVAPFVETDHGDKDGIPTALLEGMASGLPCVVTDAGSMTEVIENGRTGVVVPQRSAAALADAMLALAADDAGRARLGRAASAHVRAHFDVRTCEGVFHDRIRAVVSPDVPGAVEAMHEAVS